MAHRFPSTISAARISTFISTAAWIQGATATFDDAADVWLPEEALRNFIRRSQHETRQQPTPVQSPSAGIIPTSTPTPVKPEKPKEDDDGGSVSSISDGKSSKSSASKADKPKGDKEGDKSDSPISASPVQGINPDGSLQGVDGSPPDNGRAASSGLTPGGQAAIAVWVVIFVVGCAVAFWWFRRRRRRLAAEKPGSMVDPEDSRSQPMASQGAMPGILPTGSLGRSNSLNNNTFGNQQLNRSNSLQNNTYAGNQAPGEANHDYAMRQAAMPASTNTWQNSDTLIAGLRPPQPPPPAAAYQPASLEKGYYDPEYEKGYDQADEYVQPQRPLSNGSTRSRGRVIGLPSNPRPVSQQSGPVISAPMMGFGLPPGRDLRPLDARTVATSDTQSTIFNWR